MGRDELELLKGGIVKRKTKRRVGLFIDATGLDRATRRLDRKVDLSRLVRGLTQGVQVEVARYYTLIPYEDDARQFAFLDAVERAGVEVITKRLPPKGVKRQVSMDVHLATDLISFSYGLFENHQQQREQSKQGAAGSFQGAYPGMNSGVRRGENGGNGNYSPGAVLHGPAAVVAPSPDGDAPKDAPAEKPPEKKENIRRIATVVCPSREVSYAIFMSHQFGVETSLADFGLYGSSDGWKGVDKWVDLSTSETIWRE